MWTKQKRRTNRNRFILPLLTIGVLGYFGYHSYHGEYGLYSRAVIDARIAGLNAELDKLEDERKGLERRITLLRDGTIEKDMLDEYARRNLNLSLPNELTIIIKNAGK
ncbi:MAG: Septum formation initiator DivIC [Candidatus Tokpelaia hoelldobleri]|uniref:Septum formation initiator DivIC n=1 Tax=Candidatus Tokpelaia hoelldobleri TaxID=1902579 RepID=A0A1U9JUH8_9HYPH|nr:MAG: Septum formation initiator DivIC [Candidatus Tokpelaia hoelldoblerii]